MTTHTCRFRPLLIRIRHAPLQFFTRTVNRSQPRCISIRTTHTTNFHSLPIPPACCFDLRLRQTSPFKFLATLRVSLHKMLRNRRSFRCRKRTYTNSALALAARIASIIDGHNKTVRLLAGDASIRRTDRKLITQLASILIIEDIP